MFLTSALVRASSLADVPGSLRLNRRLKVGSTIIATIPSSRVFDEEEATGTGALNRPDVLCDKVSFIIT